MSGISSLQQAKAETSGQNGKMGINDCKQPLLCRVEGGFGGVDNVPNLGDSFNGNGGNGGITACNGNVTKCSAHGGPGGSNNSFNSGNSTLVMEGAVAGSYFIVLLGTALLMEEGVAR